MTRHEWRRNSGHGWEYDECALCGVTSNKRSGYDASMGSPRPRRQVDVSDRWSVACPETCEETAAMLVHLE